jgi:hypothetical protein
VKSGIILLDGSTDVRQSDPTVPEGRFTAPLAFDRIRAQRGLFTIHPDPTKIFYPRGMKTFLIEASKVNDFRRRLFKYGVDFWHIYPDAQGLGQQLSWQFKKRSSSETFLLRHLVRSSGTQRSEGDQIQNHLFLRLRRLPATGA